MILISIARERHVGESQRGGCRSCDVRERRAAISAHFNQRAGWSETFLRSWCCSKCVCDQVPCHCTVGLGDPDADAANVAVLPAVTVAELGLVVIDGAMLAAVTVSVADALVIDPATFMNTA